MSNDFTTEMIRFAERLADEARVILRAAMDGTPNVELKSDKSYVT